MRVIEGAALVRVTKGAALVRVVERAALVRVIERAALVRVILRRAAPKGSLSRHGSKSLGWTAILSLASLAQDDARARFARIRMTRGLASLASG